MSPASHRLQLLYFPECPHWRLADERLSEIAGRLGLSVEYQLVTTSEEAQLVSFHGSPTILVDGMDPFLDADEPIGLSCRLYRTPHGYAGAPTTAQIAAALGLEE